MAIQYTRTKQAINTGLKLEATEGTAETLTSADFVGSWSSDLIQPKYEVAEFTAGGDTGTTKLVTSKVYGELGNFTVPVNMESEKPLMLSLGAIFTSAASLDTYDFGGPSLYLANDDVLSVKSLTIGQYDGKEYFTLYGARPSAFKISAKSGEVIKATATFQGNFSKTNSVITTTQMPPSSLALNTCLGNGLTIGGKAFDFSDIEIDFKPTLHGIETAASSTGYSQWTITNIDPQITLSVYPGDPTVSDLWSMLSSNTPVAFSWSFGTLAGNKYTFSGLVQISSQDQTYSNDIQSRKIVLKAVYNSATNYKFRMSVATV